MEATMRLLPAPDADKAVSINAIHALLATMPPNDLGNRRDAGPIGGASVLTDELAGKREG
jgi:hypothetical protein